jgi:hypothetical protein
MTVALSTAEPPTYGPDAWDQMVDLASVVNGNDQALAAALPAVTSPSYTAKFTAGEAAAVAAGSCFVYGKLAQIYLRLAFSKAVTFNANGSVATVGGAAPATTGTVVLAVMSSDNPAFPRANLVVVGGACLVSATGRPSVPVVLNFAPAADGGTVELWGGPGGGTIPANGSIRAFATYMVA